MIKYWFVNILLFFSFFVKGQNTLTLQEAIGIALEQNYGIQIVKLEQLADAAQVYKSNAGIGPTVDWNVGLNLGGNNVNQKFTDGRIINRWGRTINPSTNLSVGITLFDGGRMNATYDRLGLLSEFGMEESKLMIQSTVVQIMEVYYDINRQKSTLNYLNTIIKYYQEQVKITEERWKVGKGSKLDFLQSQINLNAQLSEMAIAENNLKNAKITLNGLLNRNPNEVYDIENVQTSANVYQLETLANLAKTKNRDILLLQKARQISLKQEEQFEADRKPTISLNGSLGYNFNSSTAGFLVSNSNVFSSVGIASRWNLYDGNHRKNQIAISKINTQIIEKQQANLDAQILTDLTLAFNQYRSDEELLAFEEQNKLLAEENLSIALEKFRLGGSSILELNEAQRGLDTALNRLVNAEYNIKISELELLLLSGGLVD
jgi:outer membrane protein TolC